MEQYYDPNYDPSQSMLTYMSKFSNESTIKFEDLQEYINENVMLGVFTGAKIAAAALALIILWMVTKRKRTPIYIVNQISLLLTVIHGILVLSGLLGGFSSSIFTLTLFPQCVNRSDIRLFVATNISMVSLIASIQVSLVLQVHVIFRAGTHRRLGIFLTAVSAIIGFTTVCFYLVSAVLSVMAVYQDIDNIGDTFFLSIAYICMAISVNFIFLLLSVKLLLAIRLRRFLGLKQFDGLHILFIMSTQTIICPSILFILAFACEKNITDSLVYIAVLLVSLSLPLSSVWATAANNATVPPFLNAHSLTSRYKAESWYTDSKNDAGSFSSSENCGSGYRHGRYSNNGGSSPHQCTGGDNTVIDIEKCQYRVNPTPHTSGQFAFNQDSLETEFSEDTVVQIRTPNTEVEEEAKIFWARASITHENSSSGVECGAHDMQTNVFKTPTSQTGSDCN